MILKIIIIKKKKIACDRVHWIIRRDVRSEGDNKRVGPVNWNGQRIQSLSDLDPLGIIRRLWSQQHRSWLAGISFFHFLRPPPHNPIYIWFISLLNPKLFICFLLPFRFNFLEVLLICSFSLINSFHFFFTSYYLTITLPFLFDLHTSNYLL